MIRLFSHTTGPTEVGVRYPERTITAAGDITTADAVVYLDTTGGGFTATLPSVPTARGCMIWCKWKSGASAPTVSGTGLTHLFATLGDSITVHASLDGWVIL